MPIKESELILNPDGSVYHLKSYDQNILQILLLLLVIQIV